MAFQAGNRMINNEITGSRIFRGNFNQNYRIVDFKGLRGRCWKYNDWFGGWLVEVARIWLPNFKKIYPLYFSNTNNHMTFLRFFLYLLRVPTFKKANCHKIVFSNTLYDWITANCVLLWIENEVEFSVSIWNNGTPNRTRTYIWGLGIHCFILLNYGGTHEGFENQGTRNRYMSPNFSNLSV